MEGDGVGRGRVEVCVGEVIARESKLPEQLPQQIKKLSAAIYVFEDLVFRTFSNQLPLSEWVCEGEGRR
jgi:hypothetical protein